MNRRMEMKLRRIAYDCKGVNCHIMRLKHSLDEIKKILCEEKKDKEKSSGSCKNSCKRKR